VAGSTVAQALPYVYWMLLSTLAVGALAFVALTAWLSDATRGYLGFTAFAAGLLAVLALLADMGLAAAPALVIGASSAEADLVRRAALAAFATAAFVFALSTTRPGRRSVAAAIALFSGITALGAAAVGWAPSAADAVPLAIQLGLLSAATGGSLAAITLGHWYLVTPRVSERPLLLQTRLLASVVALQLATFVVWALFGGGPRQEPFEALTGGAALLGWLRLAVTLVFPLILVAMAYVTARTRSMESATGLLYITIAAVLAGTIGASVLYVSEGLLV
jgi:hypothetical protein